MVGKSGRLRVLTDLSDQNTAFLLIPALSAVHFVGDV